MERKTKKGKGKEKEGLGFRSVIDNDTMNKILAIPLPIHNQNDELIWGPTANGQISIKSAIWLHYENSIPHVNQALLNNIWKLNVPPKIKVFGWLLARMRLRTRERIAKYQPHIDPNCPLCYS